MAYIIYSGGVGVRAVPECTQIMSGRRTERRKSLQLAAGPIHIYIAQGPRDR